jgi:hypothetical protein
MANKKRTADAKVAIQRISGRVSAIANRNSPYFGNAEHLNDLNKSKAVQSFIGGKFNIKRTGKQAKDGKDLFNVTIADPKTSQPVTTFSTTAAGIIDRLDSQMAPGARTEMRNAVKKEEQKVAKTLAILKENPSIQEMMVRGIPLNAVQSEIYNQQTLHPNKSEKEIAAILIKKQEAEEAEIKAESRRRLNEENRKVKEFKHRQERWEKEPENRRRDLDEKVFNATYKMLEDWQDRNFGATPEQIEAQKGKFELQARMELGGLRPVVGKDGKPSTGKLMFTNSKGQYCNEYGEPVKKVAHPSSEEDPEKTGLRADGTKKGPGFLGALKRPDGKVSTELSIGVEIDGKETEIPTLVPTLTKKEINHLLGGKKPTDVIVNKAIKHAKKRIAQGKSPFFEEGEKETSDMTEQQLREALFKKTGRADDLYPPPRTPFKNIKKAGQKVGKAAMRFFNKPVNQEDLSRYSRRMMRTKRH